MNEKGIHTYRTATCDAEGKTEIYCSFCGGTTIMNLEPARFINWANGMLIQTAFPNLSTDQRETLITGLCDSCQRKVYGDD